MANNRPLSRPSMFPLMLDVASAPIFLIGTQAGLVYRLAALDEYGATAVKAFVPEADAEFAGKLGNRLLRRWPDVSDFQEFQPRLVFIGDVEDSVATPWRDMAHAVGALVHVQDRIHLCDFHMPAILRRGHLQVTVSTDGAAPGLARILRDYLGTKVFGEAWTSRMDEIAQARNEWKQQGLPMAKLHAALVNMLRSRGWLSDR